MRPIRDRTAIAFLAGFALCYLGGAYLCFNIMITMRYSVEDALPRAALWWWTERTANNMLAVKLKDASYVAIP